MLAAMTIAAMLRRKMPSIPIGAATNFCSNRDRLRSESLLANRISTVPMAPTATMNNTSPPQFSFYKHRSYFGTLCHCCTFLQPRSLARALARKRQITVSLRKGLPLQGPSLPSSGYNFRKGQGSCASEYRSIPSCCSKPNVFIIKLYRSHV